MRGGPAVLLALHPHAAMADDEHEFDFEEALEPVSDSKVGAYQAFACQCSCMPLWAEVVGTIVVIEQP